jgi:hypothetical protein
VTGERVSSSRSHPLKYLENIPVSKPKAIPEKCRGWIKVRKKHHLSKAVSIVLELD